MASLMPQITRSKLQSALSMAQDALCCHYSVPLSMMARSKTSHHACIPKSWSAGGAPRDWVGGAGGGKDDGWSGSVGRAEPTHSSAPGSEQGRKGPRWPACRAGLLNCASIHKIEARARLVIHALCSFHDHPHRKPFRNALCVKGDMQLNKTLPV